MGYPYLFFIARRFLLHTFGKIRCGLYARRLQISLSFACLLGAAWVAYASVNVIVTKQIIAGMAEETLRQRSANSELLGEVSEYDKQLTRLTRDLEANQALLLSQLAEGGRTAEDIAEIERQLKVSVSERARVEVARANLRQRLQGFEAELSEIDFANPHMSARAEALLAAFAPQDTDAASLDQARAHLGQELDQVRTNLAETREAKKELQSTLERVNQEVVSTETTGRQLAAEKARLQAEVHGHKQQLGQAEAHQTHLMEQIANLETALNEAVWRSEGFHKDRAILNARIAGLEGRVIRMRDSQQAILERLTERSLFNIDKIEDTIAMTGINVDKLLSKLPASVKDDDQGGPFIPGDYVSEEDPVFLLQQSIARLDLRMDRWESLQALAGALPLTAPLKEMRLTSGFGLRPDPFTGRMSGHHGLDLGAPMRTKVFATAPGKVVFAGWNGLYGRFVDIDHGFGIHTRYGHLRKILVKQGQETSHRDVIGLLGSSGRSTGPHLHYEIRVKGKPLDPMKFLNTGQSELNG